MLVSVLQMQGDAEKALDINCCGADMSNREIVMHGRQRMNETDAELQRGKKIVTETEDVAVKTAAQLKNQTDQMGRVVDDLNEIEFSMQRASKVIRDITRGLATDKCVAGTLIHSKI